jgi:hypothetical protein
VAAALPPARLAQGRRFDRTAQKTLEAGEIRIQRSRLFAFRAGHRRFPGQILKRFTLARSVADSSKSERAAWSTRWVDSSLSRVPLLTSWSSFAIV